MYNNLTDGRYCYLELIACQPDAHGKTHLLLEREVGFLFCHPPCVVLIAVEHSLVDLVVGLKSDVNV